MEQEKMKYNAELQGKKMILLGRAKRTDKQ